MGEFAFGEALLERFVVPLLLGRKVHIGAPLEERGAERLLTSIMRGLDETSIGKTLQQARLQQLLALGYVGAAPRLADEGPAICPLIALHDLLFLAHPEATRLKPERLLHIARHACRLCQEAKPDVEQIEVTSRLAVLYRRHSLLGRLWELHRQDVIRTRGNKIQLYRGVAPPRRVLGKEFETDQVTQIRILPELAELGEGQGLQVLRAMLWASPLTDLLQPTRAGLPLADLPLDLLSHGPWLAQKPVARLLVRRYLQLGLFAVAPVLTALLVALLQPANAALRASGRPELFIWLCLLGHLHLSAHVLAAQALPPADSAPALLDFYALYAAFFAQHPALSQPPDIKSNVQLFMQIEHHVQSCRDLGGSQRVHHFSELLRNMT